jgi:hypothetical protein
MATLKKMTRVGADVRQIARLLQAKAPEGHMLAYITPEEADLLKSQGGSGKPHADTGIPSFENEFSYDMYGESATPNYTPQYQTNTPVFDYNPTALFTSGQTPQVQESQAAPSFDVSQFASQVAPTATPTITPDFATTGVTTYGPDYGRTPEKPIDTSRPAAEKGIMARLSEATGLKEDTLARIGIGGVQAILGSRTAKKAAEQGQAGKKEMQALAAPYQQQGQQLSSAAQRGELTPVSQQQLQTVQAQVAQQASARGGVGAAQAAAQVEAFRNQLLQQQYDYGLKLSSIGDNIALGAIKTGLQADQYVQQLTNSYYNNIARTVAGMPPSTQVTQQPGVQ